MPSCMPATTQTEKKAVARSSDSKNTRCTGATISAAIAKATVSTFNPERSSRAVIESNLFDLDQKYAYVVTSAEALTYMERFPLKN